MAVVNLYGLPGVGIVEDGAKAVIAVIKTTSSGVLAGRALWFGFSHALFLLSEARESARLAPSLVVVLADGTSLALSGARNTVQSILWHLHNRLTGRTNWP